MLQLTDATLTPVQMPVWELPSTAALPPGSDLLEGGVPGVTDEDVDEFLGIVRG